MLGATETGLETGDRNAAGPSWGRLELQLLERLALRAAVEFCAALHAVSGLPLTIPCLWPVSVEGTSPPRCATAGFSGGGSGAGVLGEGVVALLEESPEGGATTAAAAGTVTAEVVLAEVDLPAAEVWNLEVGDVIPLGREPGPDGEVVYLDVPGVGRWPGLVISRDGVMEFRRLPPPEQAPS
jgi:hypothetical protein